MAANITANRGILGCSEFYIHSISSIELILSLMFIPVWESGKCFTKGVHLKMKLKNKTKDYRALRMTTTIRVGIIG